MADEKEQSKQQGSNKDEVALELMKFIAMTTGYGKGGAGAGFSGKTAKTSEEYADSLLELFERCRTVVRRKDTRGLHMRMRAAMLPPVPEFAVSYPFPAFFAGAFLTAFFGEAFFTAAFFTAAFFAAFLGADFTTAFFFAAVFLTVFFGAAFLGAAFLVRLSSRQPSLTAAFC